LKLTHYPQTGQIDNSFNQTGARTEDFELPDVVTNEDISVPEPSALLLLISALSVISLRARHRPR
jgi:hypothetical protein